MSNNRKNGRASGVTPKQEVKPLIPKTEGQANFIRTIAENDFIICNGMAGTGKAGSLDSLVYTIDGAVRMGDIKLGQLVCTPDGDYARVLGIYPQGKKEIFKVTFSDGSSTECCKEHLWHTKTVINRDYKKDGSVKTLEQISKTLIYNKKRNHSIPITSEVFFKEKELPIDAYVLGLLLGDVYLGKQIGFSTTDNEIKNSIESNLITCEAKLMKEHKTCDYYINGIKFKKELELLGLRGKISNNKFIPKIYKINSIENRIAILQGLMDTDGTIGKNGNVTFTSVSNQLALDVQFLVQSLGGIATITERVTNYTYQEEKRSGQRSYTLHINLPNHIIPFRLERKIARIIPKTKYFPKRFIDSIESLGLKDAQCIYIDSDDHLYLTDNFIVTHNTHISIGMAVQYLLDKSREIEKIIMTRPLTACGPGMGHLPGDIEAKTDPFTKPVMDALKYFLPPLRLQTYLDNKTIEFQPMETMRGANFHNSFVIMDEMQNCSYMQLKMFATRIGENTKYIVSGDLRQSDLDNWRFNNSADIQTRFIDNLMPAPGVGYCELGINDIVRSGIAREIIMRLP